MTTPLHRRCFTGAMSLIFLAVCGSAAAQYVWLDEKGTRQFSDRPPPSSVPAARILKQPGGISSAPTAAQSSAPAAPAEKTTAEKNAEFRKRQLEREEKEKKTAEEGKLAADKARNCERAQEYQRSLEAGVRISRTERNGERSYLSDEQRERDLNETRRMLSECKS
ncbi:DUF4124 domain-containing protein [Noviherbaspirillum aerium]|uniref:DUF4124 domain-containing protein n=1 Tax=Noviherbaspirillum aerium TaxID=2588497 RepID=UPI001CEFAD1D|nr:DUF4124 domain-containing protein [Noviherbaspirillum aerium]